MTVYPTPTPIPIDDMPPEFQGYVVGFFRQLFDALRQVEIPFTHVTAYDVFIGTFVAGFVITGIAVYFGFKGGNSTKHE